MGGNGSVPALGVAKAKRCTGLRLALCPGGCIWMVSGSNS